MFCHATSNPTAVTVESQGCWVTASFVYMNTDCNLLVSYKTACFLPLIHNQQLLLSCIPYQSTYKSIRSLSDCVKKSKICKHGSCIMWVTLTVTWSDIKSQWLSLSKWNVTGNESMPGYYRTSNRLNNKSWSCVMYRKKNKEI